MSWPKCMESGSFPKFFCIVDTVSDESNEQGTILTSLPILCFVFLVEIDSIAVHTVCAFLAASLRNCDDINFTSLKGHDTADFLHCKLGSCSRNKSLRTNRYLLHSLLLSAVLLKTGLSTSHKINPCSESLQDP